MVFNCHQIVHWYLGDNGKQQTLTLSSFEAEYVELAATKHETKFLTIIGKYQTLYI